MMRTKEAASKYLGQESDYVEFELSDESQAATLSWENLVNFFIVDGSPDRDRILWLSNGAFVRYADEYYPKRINCDFPWFGTRIKLAKGTALRHTASFTFHLSNQFEESSITNNLFGSRDDRYMHLTFWQQRQEQVLPLQPYCLQILCWPAVEFTKISLSLEHCRALANGCIQAVIFLNCGFLREFDFRILIDGQVCPEKLTFRQLERSPSDYILRLLQAFRQPSRLKHLIVEGENLDHECCLAAAEINLDMLEVTQCRLADHGRAFTEAMRNQTGPRGLGLIGTDLLHQYFRDTEAFVAFVDALSTNVNMRKLKFDCYSEWIDWRAFFPRFSQALRKNQYLEELSVQLPIYGDFSLEWWDCASAMAKHPSLLRIMLTNPFRNETHCSPWEKSEGTKLLAKLLSSSTTIQNIRFINNHYDETEWDKCIVPLEDCNQYRGRIASIGSVRTSARSALLGESLAKFAAKPWLMWMVLSQNQDVLS